MNCSVSLDIQQLVWVFAKTQIYLRLIPEIFQTIYWDIYIYFDVSPWTAIQPKNKIFYITRDRFDKMNG